MSFALSAYGYAFSDADPVRALGAVPQGLVIARGQQRVVSGSAARVEVAHGDPLAALDFMALAIRFGIYRLRYLAGPRSHFLNGSRTLLEPAATSPGSQLAHLLPWSIRI